MRSPLWSLSLISVLFHVMVIQALWFYGDGGSPQESPASLTQPTTLVLMTAPEVMVQSSLLPMPAGSKPFRAVKLPTVSNFDQALTGASRVPTHSLQQMEGTVLTAAIDPPPIPTRSVAVAPLLIPHLRALNLSRKEAVVFLLDISGSMYEPCQGSTRLILAQQALAEQIRALPNGTPFAVAKYGESAIHNGPLEPADDDTRDAAVRFIFDDANLGGGTNLPAGFAEAKKLRPRHIVLATDGDLNMADTTVLGHAAEILGEEKNGPSLTILAIFPRAGTDAERVLPALVDQQGGNYITQPFDRVTAASTPSGP